MRRYFVCFLTLLSLGLNVHAQTVTVDDIEALSEGETVQFKLHVSGVAAMTSMHFEIVLPDGFMVSGVNATSDWTAMFSREGGVVGAISSSDNAFNGEGDAATISVVTPITAVGEYPVTINNIRINGTELGATVSFKVNVVEKHTILLDETSTTAPEAANNVNVRVLRTINANEWSTLVLPFSMTAEQVTAAFGEDVKLADFTSWSSEEDSNGEIVFISIKFTTIDAIEANHPCLIKLSSAISEFTVDGVDIDPDEEPTVQVGKKKVEKGFMIGTYVAQTEIPEDDLFLSENKFWYSTGLTQMKAFRAYFELYDVLAIPQEANVKIRSMIVDKDETTGISDIATESKKGVYTLQGVALGEKDVKQLPKGMYVVDGKKVVK